QAVEVLAHAGVDRDGRPGGLLAQVGAGRHFDLFLLVDERDLGHGAGALAASATADEFPRVGNAAAIVRTGRAAVPCPQLPTRFPLSASTRRTARPDPAWSAGGGRPAPASRPSGRSESSPDRRRSSPTRVPTHVRPRLAGPSCRPPDCPVALANHR